MLSKQLYFFFLAVICIINCNTSIAQTVAVTGYVVEANSGEPVVFASVSLINMNEAGTYTDLNGFFRLTRPEKTDSELFLRVQYPGFKDTLIAIGASTSVLKIALSNSATLPVINVNAANQKTGYSPSIISPEVAVLRKMPVLLGEVDLLKSLTLLPGISGGIEGTANLQLRGGNSSQTSTIIDGIELYNTGHLGGFLSAIDPFGVKGITVYKGGVPARFGGRLSGVVDIDLRDGRSDKSNTELSIGTATLRAGKEGPLGKKGKYLVAGRYSYPSLLVNAFTIGSFEKEKSGDRTNASLYDAMIKTVWQEKRSRWSMLFYTSGDQGLQQDGGQDNLFLDEYQWNTTAVSLTQLQTLSSALQLESQVAYLAYGYRYNNVEKGGLQTEDPFYERLFQGSALKDLSLKSELKWFGPANLVLRGGLGVILHDFSSEAQETMNEGVERQVLDENLNNVQYNSYGQLEYDFLNNRLKSMIGLRLSGAQGTGKSLYVEPRLRLSYRPLKNVFINGGVDWNTQYVHQLTTTNSIFPSDIWILADKVFQPSRAQQTYLGLAYNRNAFTLSIEVFDKKMENLLRLKNFQQDLLAIPADWRANIATNGAGRVRGLEVYLQKKSEKLDVQVAYTLSRSERRFDEINAGNWFPFDFDRTHDGSLSLQYRLKKGWSLATIFIYQTGSAITLPVAITADYFVFGTINNARIPDYHRADVSFQRTYKSKKREGVVNTLSLGVYNLYNRDNPVDFRVEPTNATSINPQTGQVVLTEGFKVAQQNLFPFLPSINYSRRF